MLFTFLLGQVLSAQEVGNLSNLKKQIESQSIPPVKAGVNIIFLVKNKELCDKIDCKTSSFKTSQYEVRILSEEDLFIRSIKNFVKIEQWNSSANIQFVLSN